MNNEISNFLGVQGYQNDNAISWIKNQNDWMMEIDLISGGETFIFVRCRYNQQFVFDASMNSPLAFITQVYWGAVTRDVLVIENSNISLCITNHESHFEFSVGSKEQPKQKHD